MVRISEPMTLSKDTLFGMSNAGLDTWDKVHRGKSLMDSALSSDIVIAPVTPEEFSVSGLTLSFTEIKKIEEQC